MKNPIVKFLVAVGFLGVASAAPIVPTEMQWVVSYETVAFDTVDGDLGMNEYAVKASSDEAEFYIRTTPKNQGNWYSTTSIEAIKNKKEVSIRCEKCAYYSEFFSKNGKTVRTPFEGRYSDLKEIKNAPLPRKTELVSVLSAEAAVTLDNTSSATGVDASSISWNHTVTSNTDGAFLMYCSSDNTGYAHDSATYNSVSMTLILQEGSSGGSGDHEDSLWYLTTPDTGTHAVVCNIASSNSLGGGAVSYTGVGSVVAGNANSAGNDASAINITVTTVADQLVVGGCGSEDTPNITGEGQTERVSFTGAFGNVPFDMISEELATGVTVDFGCNSSQKQMAIIAVPLAPVDGGGGATSTAQSIIWFE